MAWGKIDDNLWGSPKWLATPPRARALWVTALSWCMNQLTDGYVPAHVLSTLGGNRTDARNLVATRLWKEADGGWIFHDWLDYQPSREQVLAERAAAAERQRRAREKAKSRRESRRDKPVTHAVSHASVTPLVTVPPTRPDPITTNTSPPVGLLSVVHGATSSVNRHLPYQPSPVTLDDCEAN